AAHAADIVGLVGEGDDVEVKTVATPNEVMDELGKGDVDCLLVNLGAPGSDSLALIEQVKGTPRHQDLPIVIYADQELTPAEERTLRKYAESIVLKTSVGSREQLLNDTA